MITDEAAITRLVQETFDHCAKYLREVGVSPNETDVWTAARAVVWSANHLYEDGFDRLRQRIGELEAIVGLPKDEKDI